MKFGEKISWDSYLKIKQEFELTFEEFSLQCESLEIYLQCNTPKAILASTKDDGLPSRSNPVLVFENFNRCCSLSNIFYGIEWLLQIYCYQTRSKKLAEHALKELASISLPWLVLSLRALQSLEASDDLIEHSSRLIANLSGRGSSGEIRRYWEFSSFKNQRSSCFGLSVRETSFVSSDLGCLTWGCGEALSHMLASGYVPLENNDVLEIGSGTGIAGLVASYLFADRKSPCKVFLTDYQESIVCNLDTNIRDNDLVTVAEAVLLDWRCPQRSSLWGRTFRIILGADLIYDMSHARLVPLIIELFLSSDTHSAFHLVLPIREKFAAELSTFFRNMERLKPGIECSTVVNFEGELGCLGSDCSDSEQEYKYLIYFRV